MSHSAALSLAVVPADVEAYADAFAGESSLFELHAVETSAVDESAGGAFAEKLSTWAAASHASGSLARTVNPDHSKRSTWHLYQNMALALP